MTANKNAADLAKIARELNARVAVVADPSAYRELKAALSGTGIEAASGEAAVIEAAERPADWLMAAVSGAVGLKPTLAAVKRGATVALANKECLFAPAGFSCAPLPPWARMCCRGRLRTQRDLPGADRRAARGRQPHRVITASGGPFRTWTREAMRSATLEQALKHPNWSMGPKITIDSATMFNKVLELIEAHHLFAVEPEKLAVLVHPQSIIHGMVEYRDGSVIAHLGSPDMRIPIAHCLAWPSRIDGPAARLDLAKIGSLTFEAPDLEPLRSLAAVRSKPAGLLRPFSMRPTKLPWRLLSRDGSGSAPLRNWWKPHLGRLSAEMPPRNPKISTRPWPLTIWQGRWPMTSCPK